jgi:uncharacterized OB-fold protein
MALSEKAARNLARKNQLDPDPVLKALAPEIDGTAQADDVLRVPFRIGTTLNRSMCHASRFFRELRDNGIFLAGRCPACGSVLFPPIRPVCLRCIRHGRLVEYEPLEMGPQVEGSVLAWSKLVRGTSKQLGAGEVVPAIVRVDGAENGHWQLVRPSGDQVIRVGSRVRSVLVPQEDRTGEVSDYSFVLV